MGDSKDVQTYVVAIENKFVTGTQATGGQFSFTWPNLPFIPDEWIVRSMVYDDVVGPGTILLQCADLGGVILNFGAGPDTLVWPACPQIVIKNYNRLNLGSRQSTFICTHAGAAVTTLNGALSIILELRKYSSK
jgi:hypothetical protein